MIKKFFGAIFLAMIFFAQSALASPHINYQVHVENYGWMQPVADGEVAGTVGHGKRIEAIVIDFPEGIEYNAHVQNIGWQGWCYSGEVAGTVGESLRLEAIRIKLKGHYASEYDVYYRAHVQNIGWMEWVRNGQVAGTEGQNLRMEALQIELVRKGSGYERGKHGRNRYERV